MDKNKVLCPRCAVPIVFKDVAYKGDSMRGLFECPKCGLEVIV